MSKSKRNTVDPDDIISTYGADIARWFMLSDSPPDRDVNWTERGVQGAWRFAQRLWRLVGDCVELAASAPAERPRAFGEAALAVRKAAHRALARISDEIERLHFNVCVAQIYELTNTLSEAVNDAKDGEVTPDLQWAIREAAEILIVLFHPMMPHLAEECYSALGHDTLVAQQPWPELDPDLLIEDTITLPVQVNGRKRADVTVARDAGQRDVEAAALALPLVQRALEGKRPKRVIVVPQRIVNIVA
jgi:leucyl-tRNA synthetase